MEKELFDELKLLRVHRTGGFVHIPREKSRMRSLGEGEGEGEFTKSGGQEEWDGHKSFVMCSDNTHSPANGIFATPTTTTIATKTDTGNTVETPHFPPSLPDPIPLERSQTMSGNIAVFESSYKHGATTPLHSIPNTASNRNPSPQAFWLQRKLGVKSRGGIVRLAYQLQQQQQQPPKHIVDKQNYSDGGDDGNAIESYSWELETNEFGSPIPVKIAMIRKKKVLESNQDTSSPSSSSPMNELMALALVGENIRGMENSDCETTHVERAIALGSCERYFYIVTPYYTDGTLLDYCLTKGSLDESTARFFFRQILQGLQTLQQLELCHQNLSLDVIYLQANHVVISQLDWSTRCTQTMTGESHGEDQSLLIPGGINPQIIAPEYFGDTKGKWDGFAVDLWAAGLILYSMVVSPEALFVAPVSEDKKFVSLCIRGQIIQSVERYTKSKGLASLSLSDELISLLSGMLNTEPQERYSLKDVMAHPWMTDTTTTPHIIPTERI